MKTKQETPMKNNLRLLEIVLRILRQKSFKEKLCSFGFDEGARRWSSWSIYFLERNLKQHHQNMVLTSFLPICYYIWESRFGCHVFHKRTNNRLYQEIFFHVFSPFPCSKKNTRIMHVVTCLSLLFKICTVIWK